MRLCAILMYTGSQKYWQQLFKSTMYVHLCVCVRVKHGIDVDCSNASTLHGSVRRNLRNRFIVRPINASRDLLHVQGIKACSQLIL